MVHFITTRTNVSHRAVENSKDVLRDNPDLLEELEQHVRHEMMGGEVAPPEIVKGEIEEEELDEEELVEEIVEEEEELEEELAEA